MADVFQINITKSSENEARLSHHPTQGSSFIYQSGSFKNKTRESESLVPLSQTDTVVGKIFEGGDKV